MTVWNNGPKIFDYISVQVIYTILRKLFSVYSSTNSIGLEIEPHTIDYWRILEEVSFSVAFSTVCKIREAIPLVFLVGQVYLPKYALFATQCFAKR